MTPSARHRPGPDNTHERTVRDLRPLGLPHIPMIGRYRTARARRALALHAHAGTLEICYLARGTQRYRVGRRVYVLHGGDLFVTFPDETHSTDEAPEERGILYWLQLRLPRRGEAFLGCPPADARELVRRLLAMRPRHFRGDPALARLFDTVLADAGAPRHPLQRLQLSARLTQILLRVLACAQRRAGAARTPPIQQLLRTIDADPALPHRPADLAARVGLSLSRFKARFRAEVGIPPAEYVLRRKLAVAAARLAVPGATVTAVAHDLGFSSSQYFATVFKRYFNRSPRRRHV